MLTVTSAVIISSCGKKDDAAAAGPPEKVQSVEVMKIDTMTLRKKVGLVGSIAANESAELRAEIPGVITAIEFEEGSKVSKGDVLARLDVRELNAQIAETRAQFELAKSKLDRNRKLLSDQAVSQLEFDAAQAEFTRLKAALQVLDVRIKKSTIIAPFDGVAGSRTVSVGDYVSSSTVITTIDDLSRVKVEMDVPERYLTYLQKDTTFDLRTATLEKPVTGKVYFVSSSIDPTTRATLVKGYVENPPASMRPGMFANINLILETVENALVVPETAVLNSAKGSVLIMPKEKDGVTVATFVPVKLGLRIPGYVQVSPVGPPVKKGDTIVSSGVGGLILYPGLKLKPVEPVVKPGMPEATDRNLNQ